MHRCARSASPAVGTALFTLPALPPPPRLYVCRAAPRASWRAPARRPAPRSAAPPPPVGRPWVRCCRWPAAPAPSLLLRLPLPAATRAARAAACSAASAARCRERGAARRGSTSSAQRGAARRRQRPAVACLAIPHVLAVPLSPARLYGGWALFSEPCFQVLTSHPTLLCLSLPPSASPLPSRLPPRRALLPPAVRPLPPGLRPLPPPRPACPAAVQRRSSRSPAAKQASLAAQGHNRSRVPCCCGCHVATGIGGGRRRCAHASAAAPLAPVHPVPFLFVWLFALPCIPTQPVQPETSEARQRRLQKWTGSRLWRRVSTRRRCRSSQDAGGDLTYGRRAGSGARGPVPTFLRVARCTRSDIDMKSLAMACQAPHRCCTKRAVVDGTATHARGGGGPASYWWCPSLRASTYQTTCKKIAHNCCSCLAAPLGCPRRAGKGIPQSPAGDRPDYSAPLP